MSEEKQRQFVMGLFWRLRREGITLGVAELLDALAALDDEWAEGDALKSVLRLLWCKSRVESRDFDLAWDEVAIQAAAPAPPPAKPLPVPEKSEPFQPKPLEPKREPGAPQPQPSGAPASGPSWGTLPVRAPFTPIFADEGVDLRAFSPVSRRQMVYSWRYLRRPVFDGPPDVLDIAETVGRVAHQGFYLAPVYRRRERNHAHLLLLLDQGGSMAPVHRLTRDLAETARDESAIGSVDVLYFRNAPADDLFFDRYCTEKVAVTRVLDGCTDDTSILIVSDAGAARGRLSVERVLATTRFVGQLRTRTALLAWLNPMPVSRWEGTTAAVIAHSLPMFPMSHDGLAHAIDAARGQLGLQGR